MSEQHHDKKPDNTLAPPENTGRRSSKSYDELLHGFEEIRKIQTNQEIFEKRGKAMTGFDDVQETAGEQEAPDS